MRSKHYGLHVVCFPFVRFLRIFFTIATRRFCVGMTRAGMFQIRHLRACSWVYLTQTFWNFVELCDFVDFVETKILWNF